MQAQCNGITLKGRAVAGLRDAAEREVRETESMRRT